MFKVNALIGFACRKAANLEFAVDGVDLNGTTQFLSRASNFTSLANTNSGIFSAWIRLDGGNATEMIILNGVDGGNNDGIDFERAVDNRINLQSAGGKFQVITSGTYTSGATWRHILCSWNGAANNTHLYINDVSDKGSGTAGTPNTALAAVTNWYVGKPDPNFGAGTFFNGCIAELYYAPGQFLDFSNVTNRRKFISAVGKPIDLGATGSLPTGTAPKLFLHIGDGESTGNFATNRSGAGDMTITAGPLTTSSTSPTD